MKFDMHRIGQTIARLRREHNMTQMKLADEMGVSFQAVSNWERGQSMPDISKLPELAELFSVTIDELLGCSVPLVEQAAAGRLMEHLKELSANGAVITVEEVAEAAPILPPDQMERLTDRLMDMPQLPNMRDLLPFLSTEKVNALIRQAEQAGENIADYVPFCSTAVVEEIAQARSQEGKDLRALMPFLSTEKVNALIRQAEQAGESIADYAPFCSTAVVDEIAQARGRASRSFIELAPFMSSDALNGIACEWEKRGEPIVCLAPFMSPNVVEEIALARLQMGRSVRELLPFVGDNLLSRMAEMIANKP